jgi:DNA-binding HxlR family transcriptional regulator
MREKSFGNLQCPIARSLERVGERWSILIRRDAFHGLTRFDQFQTNLGIAPNILARRLKSLVEAGLLERRRYSDHPPREEYLLTDRGRDFRPVIWSLLAWGNKHFAPEGVSVQLVDSETGLPRIPCWWIGSAAGRSPPRPSAPPRGRPPTSRPSVATPSSPRTASPREPRHDQRRA